LQNRIDGGPDGNRVQLSDKEVERKATVSTPIQPEPCTGITMAEAILQVALLSGATENEFALIPDPGTGDLAYDSLVTKAPPSGPTPPPALPPVARSLSAAGRRDALPIKMVKATLVD
jgi:hypothetical protein